MSTYNLAVSKIRVYGFNNNINVFTSKLKKKTIYKDVLHATFIEFCPGNCNMGNIKKYKAIGNDGFIVLQIAMYYVYILYSLKANKYYIGHTSNPCKRLEQHLDNTGEK